MSKIVLAYSGGLDTSVILKWLAEKGHEVIALVADVGQADDLEAIKAKALATGASAVVVSDLKEELVVDYVFAAVKANAVYEGRYLLGTALARPLIAKAQVAAAHAVKADIVAHGATGKGNDQVRFELSYAALDPKLRVYSPWKDPEFLSAFEGRPGPSLLRRSARDRSQSLPGQAVQRGRQSDPCQPRVRRPRRPRRSGR